MTVEIRRVTTITDCQQMTQLEALIWHKTTSDKFLMALAHNQGVLLLALEGDTAVGFCYSFVAFDQREGHKRLRHHSQILGIHPAYRNQQIGYQLKMAQRTAILAQGIDHMTWTFDPLETRNANLNLHKLGAVCCTYAANFYGEAHDPLNQGLPTDRFIVDWWLDTEWVRHPRPLPTSPEAWLAQGAQLLPFLPSEALPPLDAAIYLVEAPCDMQTIKQNDLSLAQQWRLHTRRIFTPAFARGYTAIDLLRTADRCYYILQKEWQPQ